MQSINAIMDTSFLIDWVKYDKRDLIFNYYDLIFITESVLNEIRTETPLLWISEGLAKGRIKVLEEDREVRRKALLIVEATRGLPIRSADYPEAVCLVFGKELRVDVLTENGVWASLNFHEFVSNPQPLGFNRVTGHCPVHTPTPL
ncbi:MAG: hypothetical protein RXQ80_08865 [Sulfolobaceae archaeon]